MDNLKNNQRIEKMHQRLEQALSPNTLTIRDDSPQHIGHAGALSGKGHFTIIIAADAFAHCSPVKAHQMIYDALDDMMDTDIHALQIQIKRD